MLFLFCLGVFVITLTLYLQKVCSRFRRYGVKCKTPIPLLGNAAKLVLKICHISEDYTTGYRAFPNERFVGRFELMRPVVMIRDLDLIKKVTIKDFEHFTDHRTIVNETVDTVFGRALFFLRGREWKDMRSTLSPAFTGSKLRAMVPFMVDVSKQMSQMIRDKIKLSDSVVIDIDCKDMMSRYSNDVIASCGFGIQINSHTDTNNEFYLGGKSIAHFGFKRVLVYFGYIIIPNIMKKLNLKIVSENSVDYFKHLFSNTISEREKHNIYRPDIIHLLMESKKGNAKHVDKVQSKNEESEVDKRFTDRSWSDSDLVAQAIFLFVAGFESISSASCFLLYELALNPDVQERLVRELRDSEARNGKIDYNSIQELKYLDMVVSELLRLWPIGIAVERICTKNYNLGKPNDNATSDYVIHKGESILIPIQSIHHDLNYFSDPEKFDPERFSEENKTNIKPYSYIPFGSGPRSCIGSRFAVLELKAMICHLLLQFEVSPAEKTRIPVKLVPGSFTLAMEGGHWIRFKLRDQC